MKNIKVVAFDCDGVMFDTINTNKVYYNYILNHFGKLEMTTEQLAHVHMHTVHEAIRSLFKDQHSIEKASAYCKTLNYFQFLQYMEMEPFLKILLERLKGKYKTAVATNRTDTMSHILTEYSLDKYFDIVVTALDVKKPKPSPDPLIKILKHFKIESENLIYIGDSKLDEEASTAAGVFFAAYKNNDLNADFHINSLQEIEKILADN